MEAKIRSFIKTAMKAKNKDMQITYKNILETAQKTAKRMNKSVTDDMIVNAIKTEMNQLNETKQYYAEGSADYASIERKLSYCEVVLPKMATEDEIRDFLISNSIEKNMGKAMSALKEKFGTCIDNKLASQIAMSYVKL